MTPSDGCSPATSRTTRSEPRADLPTGGIAGPVDEPDPLSPGRGCWGWRRSGGRRGCLRSPVAPDEVVPAAQQCVRRVAKHPVGGSGCARARGTARPDRLDSSSSTCGAPCGVARDSRSCSAKPSSVTRLMLARIAMAARPRNRESRRARANSARQARRRHRSRYPPAARRRAAEKPVKLAARTGEVADLADPLVGRRRRSVERKLMSVRWNRSTRTRPVRSIRSRSW